MFHLTRPFKLVVLAILFAWSASHCSPASPVPTETRATEVPPTPAPIEPTAERTELAYVSFFQGYTVGLNHAERELIERFEAAHPDIKVKRKDFFSPYEDLISATPPPDVMTMFMATDPFLEAEVEKGRLMDFSDLWTEQHWSEAYSQRLQALSAVQGKFYFLPVLSDWDAVYYNQSLFERYNLTPPKTWDEFLAVCETLKDNGIAPIAIDAKYYGSSALWFNYLDLRFNGPEFHAALFSGQVPYDDPRVRQVFEAWKLLVDGGYFIKEADRFTDQEAAMAVLAGEAAMMLIAPYVWEAYSEADRAKLDFFQFPNALPEVPVAEYGGALGYLVPAKAPHPEAAQAWLAYVGSAEAQTILAQGIGMAPANSAVDPDLLSPAVRKGMALVEAADQSAPWFSLDPYYLHQFLMGREDIDSVLADLEKDRQKKFGQLESP